jgi:hypothetical protein
MTTNLAKSYNIVMRGVRMLPLVGIVEFILCGCIVSVYYTSGTVGHWLQPKILI